MRRSALLLGAAGALAFGMLAACGRDALLEPAPAGGDGGRRCDKPAPGCSCIPAWWTNEICYSGPPGTAGLGKCKSGRMTCSDDGVLSDCVGEVVPSAEVCNDLDDDCNGVVDDLADLDAGAIAVDADLRVSRTLARATVQCLTDLRGLCAYGRRTCAQNGTVACTPILTTFGEPESCNGLDDDCDGIVDNNLNNLGRCQLSDPTLKGECTKGFNRCVGGQLVCEATYTARAEICNGLDDDCDGFPDNVDADGGAPICPAGYRCAGTFGCVLCPYVFAWDGERYRYETTAGGASVVGKAKHIAEGRDVDFSPHWIRLDAAKVAYHGALGRARAKVVVGDDEITYLARAGLRAVLHPAGHEVFSSTSMQWSNLKLPDPRLLWALRSEALRTPIRASWRAVRDVTAALSSLDHRAVYAEVDGENWYELDFGPIGSQRHALLVIEGWKRKVARRLPAHVRHARPRIEVRDLDGTWRSVLELGAPRGDRKPVVVDLSSIDVPEGRWHLRLWTGTHEDGNAMWSIDRVRLTEEPAAHATVVDLGPSGAALAFHGAPSIAGREDHSRPLRVTDDGLGAMPAHEQTWGRFTRYGDVTELLASPDDRLVVMRRGDGVELEFEGIPHAADGEELTLLLDLELLYKPRAWIDGRTSPMMENVEPLPYHAMRRYPPPRRDHDAAMAAYLRDWQTRVYERGDARRTG